MFPMNKQALRADALLLLTACIWGFAFVAQRSGMEYMGPFTFNGIRFLLGGFSLVPIVLLRRAARGGNAQKPPAFRVLLGSSLLAGICLFLGASLQQVGIIYTTAGNSGFITGLYVIFTPIFAIFLGRKTRLPTWIGAALTLAGLFFLSAAPRVFGGAAPPGSLAVNIGDLITAAGALFWAFHVLVIDSLVRRVDAVALSSGQFFCCGLLSLVIAFFTETIVPGQIAAGLIPILYGGVCSAGVGYTLQVVAQKNAPPAHATILLSLEGTFAAIGGVLILSEPLGAWTLLGFALMLSGMLATQWDLIMGGRRPGAKRPGLT
ncbi:MAG: DMT family transporter [Treponema sp.]|jgi:drug/metabolite transporter (DMT)-like permease|nr:DMT family transporter [Treponema sp.]